LDRQDRFDEYIRIISVLDIDYNADGEAFKGMTSAKHLLDLFSNKSYCLMLGMTSHQAAIL
jgi:hypothetical protein